MKVAIKRVYEAPSPQDGARVLADRLWPRGLKKADAAIDLWAKNIAPSAALRRWFAHKAERFAEFTQRYREELETEEAQAELDALRDLARKDKVTLLFAAHDAEMNNAAVLRDVLRGRH